MLIFGLQWGRNVVWTETETSSGILRGDKRRLRSNMTRKVFSEDELGVLEQVIELLTVRMELDYTGEEDADWKEERLRLVSILNLLCTE